MIKKHGLNFTNSKAIGVWEKLKLDEDKQWGLAGRSKEYSLEETIYKAKANAISLCRDRLVQVFCVENTNE